MTHSIIHNCNFLNSHKLDIRLLKGLIAYVDDSIKTFLALEKAQFEENEATTSDSEFFSDSQDEASVHS